MSFFPLGLDSFEEKNRRKKSSRVVGRGEELGKQCSKKNEEEKGEKRTGTMRKRRIGRKEEDNKERKDIKEEDRGERKY